METRINNIEGKIDDIDWNEPIAESEEINVPEIDMEKVAKVESILPFKEDQEIDIFFDDETNIDNFSLYILGKKFSNQLDRYFPISTFVVAFGKKATENEMA